MSAYLEAAELQEGFSTPLGFNLVGYGCTTCIGNSGPLQAPRFPRRISDNDLIATSVLSGNRNFGGRIRLDGAGQLPGLAALVVVYALAGDMNINVAPPTRSRRRRTAKGRPNLKDIWPTLAGGGGPGRADRDARGLPLGKIRGCLQGATRKWQGRGSSPAGDLKTAPRPRTYIPEPRPISRGMGRRAGERSRTSRGRGCWRSSATMIHDRPHQPGRFFSRTRAPPAGRYLTERSGAPAGVQLLRGRGAAINQIHDAWHLWPTSGSGTRCWTGVEGGYTLGPDGSADLDLRRGRWPTRRAGVCRLVIFGPVAVLARASSRDWAAKGTAPSGGQGGDRARELRAQSTARTWWGMGGSSPFEFTGGDHAHRPLGLERANETVDIHGLGRGHRR